MHLSKRKRLFLGSLTIFFNLGLQALELQEYAPAPADDDFGLSLKRLERLEDKQDTTQGHALGLADLIRNADNNYSLQAARLQVAQALKNHSIAKAKFLPSMKSNYTFDRRDRDTPFYPNYNMQLLNTNLKLNLFNGFSDINNVREKAASYRSNSANMEYTKQNIYLQVVQQYYQYFNNMAQLVALQKKLAELRSNIKRIRDLYNEGLTTIDDLESAKAQGALSENDITDMQFSIEQNRLTLEYLTNSKIPSLRRTTILPPTLSLKERADIRALREQITAIHYQNKQLNFYPTVDINDDWQYYIQKPAYAMGKDNRFGNLYPDQQNTFGIAVGLNILDDIGINLQKQYLRLNQLSQEKTLMYKRMEQAKDEQLYRKSLDMARAKIKSSEASLKSATISYESIKRKYAANLVDFTTYLRALRTRFDAEVVYNQSLNNYEMQKANYIFYSGHHIQDYVR
ncbi:TolC family protein [Helicobacter ailurogastricus]|uniref:Probable outer membrane component of multidrug efflux pump n=1 Tax=Helicobacter ailurogastricus TaxID=1578720 RepID=A0A0K2XCW1_9HELI|nr:TolC family protein [Helicobacter ailurogastricus]CRF41292.1 Probable outer membrane component of multidrug efflux pump [Helicobacter ailurogastricus]CRF42564.1 Probable outer membrane component of multidrug efflux pump [Helicobacter ailurogastricus]CRF44584.1 Probable outer membrane component of multidrug efflux pump [Helicobacter ailurogastricus]